MNQVRSSIRVEHGGTYAKPNWLRNRFAVTVVGWLRWLTMSYRSVKAEICMTELTCSPCATIAITRSEGERAHHINSYLSLNISNDADVSAVIKEALTLARRTGHWIKFELNGVSIFVDDNCTHNQVMQCLIQNVCGETLN